MALPPDDPPPGVPEWVVTYGDMMSLLLTFFIMLVSMAEMKNDGKLRAAMDALREQFGNQHGVSGVPGKSLQTSSNLRYAASHGKRSEGGIESGSAQSKGLAGPSSSVRRIGHGNVITLGGSCLFEAGSADLTDEMKRQIEKIALIVVPRPNRIVIRGHATREITTRASVNNASPAPASVSSGTPIRQVTPLDLSFARAQNVADYIQSLGVARERLLVSAAGDSEPRVVSRNPEIQKQNRRIDVFVIDSYTTAGTGLKIE